MLADIHQIITEAETKMSSAIRYLDDELARIRAGKASPRSLTPLANVSSITTPDAKTMIITPWEKPMLKEIEKAILSSEVGITPENNGEVIRLGIPPLTEERRRSLAKGAKQHAETAKISIRNTRREVIELLKKAIKEGVPEDAGKDAEATVQKIHDKYVKQVDELYAAKEKEIMTV